MNVRSCKRIGGPLRPVWLVSLCIVAAACARSPEPPAASAAAPPAGAGTQQSPAGDQALKISFQIDPDPPRAGENRLAVSVTRSDGKALTDAAVVAVFYMPAMPSMGMPEMRSTFPLESVGDGSYHGEGRLTMSGTWDVTINVSRGDQKIGTRRFTVIAR